MKLIHKILLLSILLTIHIQHIKAQEREVIDKVIANVGGEIILLSELEEQVAIISSKTTKISPTLRCDILDQIMAQRLLLVNAKLDSVKVSDDEVNAEIEARLERILSYMNNDVKQFEEYYGKSVNQVRDEIRDDQRNQMLVEREQQSILDEVTITPAEVKEFFKTIPKDSLPYFNAEVEIGEIVIIPKVNATQRKIALDKITDIRKRILEKGEDFANLASTISDDEGSARQNGDLGWVKRGVFTPEFEAAAFNLAEGEISPIVETEFGFHIIQLLERRGNSIHTRHILIKPLITEEDFELTSNKLDSIRTLILNDSISFSAAVKKYSDKSSQSYNNDGRMLNPTSRTTYFEIAELDPDIYFTLDSMDVNEISKPIAFKSDRSETQYHIVKLLSRSKPHKANIANDYYRIQTVALSQKKNNYLEKWIQTKVKSSYVFIDDAYKNCVNLQKWKVNKLD
ncbi:MAG: peptidylprolyl isomerase [Saprospiraceae bacterium]|nr:peptidylprolyl isomerase [Saprospiraceae bacterium]